MNSLIKQFRSEDKNLFRRELENSEVIDHPNVLKVVNGDPAQLKLTYEPFSDITLSEKLYNQGISTDLRLKVACKIMEAIKHVHLKRYIILTINSSNILVDESFTNIKLFGLTYLLKSTGTLIDNHNQISFNDPKFLSPESTGRINRGIDFRSDIYSYGVVLFELFEKKVPYDGDTDLDIIYGHLGKPLPPLSENIPTAIQRIIQRCLEKEPENRYQSAEGILYDLEYCLEQISSLMALKDFRAGKYDTYRTFALSTKLFGKSLQIETLISVYKKIKERQPQLILVSGESGIGKTSFVNELSKDLFLTDGLFITSKYSTYHKTIPFMGLKNLSEKLIQVILTRINDNRLPSSALEKVIPTLSLLATQVPLLSSLVPNLEAPDTSQSLPFDYLFIKLIQEIKTHINVPIVLFLDDLQWADTGSVNALETLCSTEEIKGLMIIGSYRDDEVDAMHPLSFLVENLNSKKIKHHHIPLSLWSPSDTQEFLTASFNGRLEKLQELCYLVHQKTLGNPLYIHKILKQLFENNAMFYSEDKDKWEWLEEKISEISVSGNVLDFVLNEIQSLDLNSIELLKQASIFGQHFKTADLVNLSHYGGTLKCIKELIQKGILIPNKSEYLFADEDLLLEQLPHIELRFVHDKYHQACYELIPETELDRLHLQSGEYLYSICKEKEDQCVNFIHHFNKSKLDSKLLTSQDISQYNLKAGLNAKLASEFETAKQYFTFGISRLEKDSWKTNYKLTYTLHLEQATCEYLTKRFDDSERLITQIIDKSESDIDRVKALMSLIPQYTTMGDYKKAILIGNRSLKLLKLPRLPLKPNVGLLIYEIIKVFWNKGKKSVRDLAELKELADIRFELALGILNHMGPPAFFINQNLMSLIQIKMVNISIKNGNNAISAYAFSTFSIVLGPALGFFNSAKEFGELALNLIKKMPDTLLSGRIHFIVATFNSVWTKGLQKGLDYAEVGFKESDSMGDFVWAGYSLCDILYTKFSMGLPLSSLIKNSRSFKDYGIQTKHKDITYDFRVFKLFLDVMQNKEQLPSFRELYYGEDTFVQELKSLNRKVSLHEFLVLNMITYYFQGRIEDSYLAQRESRKYLQASLGFVYTIEHYFFTYLILSRLYEQQSYLRKKVFKFKMNSILNKFRKWADLTPETFSLRYKILQTRYSQLFNKQTKIDTDQKNLTLELNQTQNFLLKSTGLQMLFDNLTSNNPGYRRSLNKLFNSYINWGAPLLSGFIKDNYQHLLDKEENQTDYSIDYKSIVSLSHLLSQELRLDTLLSKASSILLQTASATRGALLITEGNSSISSVIDLETGSQLAPADYQMPTIFLGLILRSNKTIIIDSPDSHELLQDDLEIINKTNAKCILVLPLERQNNTLGLLYLENSLMNSAFCKDRVETIKLISSQLAISLENVDLYEKLKTQNTVLETEVELVSGKVQEQKKLDKDLQAAERVQSRLLPRKTPRIKDFVLEAYYKAARKVGGDLYDFYVFSDNKVGILLADIVGKGVQSALLTVELRNVLRQNVNEELSPAEFFTILNGVIKDNDIIDKHVPMIYGIIDVEKGEFTYSNAGHDDGLYVSGKRFQLLPSNGPPIAMFEEDEFEEETLVLKDQDKILFYTDGLTDDLNSTNEPFGLDRVQDILREEIEPGKVLDTLMKAHQEFTSGGPPQKDDTAIVAITYDPVELYRDSKS